MNNTKIVTNLRSPEKIVWLGVFLALLIVFSACKTTKYSTYFETLKKDTTISGFVNPDFEPKIKPGDNLGISINSLSTDENLKFNSTIVSANASAISVPSYLVSKSGTIKMHRFGEVKVEGLTRAELAEKLQNDLLPYLKEPLVNVSYLNHNITVMGAVARPGVINITDNNISLLDAIVLSGDITKDGKINNVMVIRENGSNREVKKINLEDNSIFSSPWYYLQPGDIVYVAPDYSKTEKEEHNRNRQTTMALIATGISIIVVLSRFIP